MEAYPPTSHPLPRLEILHLLPASLLLVLVQDQLPHYYYLHDLLPQLRQLLVPFFAPSSVVVESLVE